MPPVILVSGWGFSTRPMEPLAEALQPWPATVVSSSDLIRQASASGTTTPASATPTLRLVPRPELAHQRTQAAPRPERNGGHP